MPGPRGTDEKIPFVVTVVFQGDKGIKGDQGYPGGYGPIGNKGMSGDRVFMFRKI